MAESLSNTIIKWCSYGLIVAVIVGGLMFIWPNYRLSQSLRQEEKNLDDAIAAKRKEIAKLAENQRRFWADRDFVEHIARQNRRVFPGELIFIYEGEK